MKRKNQWLLLFGVLLSVAVISCKKDYFNGGSLQNGVFKMSAYEFMKTKPFYFDTLITVIDKSGLKEVFEKEDITFFAPTDHAIKLSMDLLNSTRYSASKDSIFIKDIPPSIWRKYLSQYLIKDKYLLKDIARYDPVQANVYPGQYMASYDGYIMNLGVQFSDYKGTRDVGPRTVVIRNIGDIGNPLNFGATIATSDLQTNNSIIHVINDMHNFGFNPFLFITDVNEYFK
ncbi:hypothetical protein DBR43_22125 [Pedobacter sp. KBW06]|uniref:fasciclin domain-containing protein n=1 Tax=Pedobacter sp. KBW06 TaxID=2153359 RepID=UPI000F59471B|nr:fasciclin domain-containing protein [Pedobacter sp. KBW06]RQO70697.1 hypothetical protein DBR43_22125 [Pedobacter sp. KBW06]